MANTKIGYLRQIKFRTVRFLFGRQPVNENFSNIQIIDMNAACQKGFGHIVNANIFEGGQNTIFVAQRNGAEHDLPVI
ncbi:MAG: hypothetical protein H6868_00680 [Rhodospirillales bacterium]|nr:hypothetical protein [Rhodospirillales bacterium]